MDCYTLKKIATLSTPVKVFATLCDNPNYLWCSGTIVEIDSGVVVKNTIPHILFKPLDQDCVVGSVLKHQDLYYAVVGDIWIELLPFYYNRKTRSSPLFDSFGLTLQDIVDCRVDSDLVLIDNRKHKKYTIPNMKYIAHTTNYIVFANETTIQFVDYRNPNWIIATIQYNSQQSNPYIILVCSGPYVAVTEWCFGIPQCTIYKLSLNIDCPIR